MSCYCYENQYALVCLHGIRLAIILHSINIACEEKSMYNYVHCNIHTESLLCWSSIKDLEHFSPYSEECFLQN